MIKNSAIALAVMLAFMLIRTPTDGAIRRKTAVAINKCRMAFLGELLSNPLNKLFGVDMGEINENLNDDITTYAKRYTELIPSVFGAALSVGLYFLFLSRQSLLAAATLSGISLIQLIPPIIVKKYMQVNYDDCRRIEANITDHVVEAVNGFDAIKLYGLKNRWLSKLSAYQKEYLHIGNKSEVTYTAQNAMLRAVDNILRFGTYALLGIYMLRGYCSLEVVVEAIFLSGRLFTGVKDIFQTIPQFALAQNAAKRLEKWSLESQPQAAPKPFESITVNGLRYAASDKEIIKGLSLHLNAQENYLITGANGAGKTTLFNLLAGLILPDDGEIRFGDSLSLPDGVYPNELLFIPQNDPTFEFSANALFDMFDQALQREMRSLAEQLGLEQENLAAPICNLSGGERKKLFLSLGFACSPRWLLLDEPTNSLDEEGKAMLFRLIQSRKGVIVISHDAMIGSVICNKLTLKEGALSND